MTCASAAEILAPLFCVMGTGLSHQLSPMEENELQGGSKLEEGSVASEA